MAGVDELDKSDEPDDDRHMAPQTLTRAKNKNDYILRLQVDDPRTHESTEVARARVRKSGEVSIDSVDLEGLDRSLALLAAIRFADYPISDFSRIAIARLFEPTADAQRDRGSTGDGSARRAAGDLLVDWPVSRRAQTRRRSLVRAYFETVVADYAADLIVAIESKIDASPADPEDISDAWQPGNELVEQRDRILRYGGTSPMSASEIQQFLELSRTTLATRRRSGALLGLPLGSDRKLVYPRWQFDSARPTHLLPGLQPALSRLSQRDPWGLADLLTSGHPALDGETPLERLKTDPSSADRIARLLEAEYVHLPTQVTKTRPAQTTGRLAEATEGISMPKSTPKQIHVVKRPEGWGAVRAGKSRSSINIQPTQAKAEQAAKDLARRSGGAEVITHGLDGRIRSSDTIGRPDPDPPIDREH